MKKFRVGIIGLGQRGSVLLNLMLHYMSNIDVVAVCDLYEDRVANAIKSIKDKTPDVKGYTDYNKMLRESILDAVIIASAWESHSNIAITALTKGIPVGMEVGGAYTVEECWELVSAYEQTKTPFMFLENCCFDKTELMATFMARDGLFGEIVHCSGAYSHDLRKEVANGLRARHYRLRNYLNRNCENYPTHELGPIAKILDINRGNRMLSLVSIASKAAGMESYVKDKSADYPELVDAKFKQGDIVNTIITCAGGQTILLTLDTTLPGVYDRALIIKGTKGMYNQSANYAVLDGEEREEKWTGIENTTALLNSAAKYEEKYLPDYWKNITEEQRKVGHGGMDLFMLQTFFDALENGDEMPLDVYDAASWMSVVCLSEQSIALGGVPVAIPDFTKGKWLIRPRKDVISII